MIFFLLTMKLKYSIHYGTRKAYEQLHFSLDRIAKFFNFRKTYQLVQSLFIHINGHSISPKHITYWNDIFICEYISFNISNYMLYSSPISDLPIEILIKRVLFPKLFLSMKDFELTLLLQTLLLHLLVQLSLTMWSYVHFKSFRVIKEHILNISILNNNYTFWTNREWLWGFLRFQFPFFSIYKHAWQFHSKIFDFIRLMFYQLLSWFLSWLFWTIQKFSRPMLLSQIATFHLRIYPRILLIHTMS